MSHRKEVFLFIFQMSSLFSNTFIISSVKLFVFFSCLNIVFYYCLLNDKDKSLVKGPGVQKTFWLLKIFKCEQLCWVDATALKHLNYLEAVFRSQTKLCHRLEEVFLKCVVAFNRHDKPRLLVRG